MIQSIRSTWRIPTGVYDLLELKNLLSYRSEAIWDEVRSPEDTHSNHVFDALNIDMLSAISNMAECLSELSPEGSISLLLDELELLPEAVRNYVFTGLRDADDRVPLKMSVSPVEDVVRSLLGPSGPQSGHDFTLIDLSYPYKKNGFGFTSELLMDLARRTGMRPTSVEQLLRRSYFDLNDATGSDETSDYSPRGDWVRTMIDLAQFDSSFQSYLANSNISADSIDQMNEPDRARFVRKIRDVVIIRNRFLRSPAGPNNESSRTGARTYQFYTGSGSVLALLEGNPRWTVNFMSSATQGSTMLPSQVSLSRNHQAEGIADLMARVRSRVLHAPVPADSELNSDPTRGLRVLELIDEIANFFKDSILAPKFNPDPVLTFTVDKRTTSQQLDLITDAVSHGTLIHVPPRDVAALTTVQGERFRLAYLFAAQYGLPPILGRSVELSTILNRKGTSKPPKDLSQPFDDSNLRLFT
jgi:hypothetical protein